MPGRKRIVKKGDQKKGDQKKDDGKDGGSKRLTREEYDRLVQGYGGLGEPEDEKEPLPEKPANETTKRGDDAG